MRTLQKGQTKPYTDTSRIGSVFINKMKGRASYDTRRIARRVDFVGII